MSEFDKLFANYLQSYQAMQQAVRATKTFGDTINDHIQSKSAMVKYVHGLEKRARVRTKK